MLRIFEGYRWDGADEIRWYTVKDNLNIEGLYIGFIRKELPKDGKYKKVRIIVEDIEDGSHD